MSAAGDAPRLDADWLNDSSEYQLNFVHGLRNPVGLRLQYRLERVGDDVEPPPPADDPLDGHRVVAEWTPGEVHMGFPGIVHGGLLLAILDDAIGRCAALRHRWVVTARLDTRFRRPAPVDAVLRVEAWLTRWQRRYVAGVARILLPGGEVALEASGTYLSIPPDLEERMVGTWAGFARYLPTGREAEAEAEAEARDPFADEPGPTPAAVTI